MKTKTTEPKKGFRKLTDEELEQVTGGGASIHGGILIEAYQCPGGKWVSTAEDCPAQNTPKF